MDEWEVNCTDNVLSQALDLEEARQLELEDYKIFLTQDTFRPITESQHDALVNQVDVSNMLDDGGPCYVAQRKPSTAETDDSDDSAVEPTHAPATVSSGTDSSRPRFVGVDEKLVESKKLPVIPPNTLRKNKWARNVFLEWRTETLDATRQDNGQENDRAVINVLKAKEDIVLYSTDELQLVLPYFLTALRKADGGEYKGESVLAIISGLQRHLCANGKIYNFFTDSEFGALRNVIDNTMKDKCSKGVGIQKKQANIITTDQEAFLWESGYLGTSNPSLLLDTVFWTVGIHFGLRGGQEHRTLSETNFDLKVDEDNKHYLQYTEQVSKTYRGGLKHRNIEPHSGRAYANDAEPGKCPVRIFEAYKKDCLNTETITLSTISRFPSPNLTHGIPVLRLATTSWTARSDE